MKSSTILSAAMLFTSTLAAIESLGCFKSHAGAPTKIFEEHNSKGKCGTLCPGSGTFAVQFKNCYCGDAMPVDSDKVDISKCNLACPAYPDDNCGGKDFYFFYDAGILNSIPKEVATVSSSSTSSATPTSTSKTSVSAPPAKTVLVTPTSTPTPTAEAATKPNVAAIAAGAVVGVLAVAAMMGGLFLFMRNRKRRAIEEEHRRNATINSFTKPPVGSAATSFNDTRLDPVMAHRRMSDGSIADNQDYSRRILKVTNA